MSRKPQKSTASERSLHGGAICKAIFRAWPFAFGHVRLITTLNPPHVDEARVTTKLRRYGLAFEYDPNTYIGRYIYYRGIFEEAILRAIECRLSPGMTFIDIGANIG